VTTPDGTPVTTVTEGDDFLLSVYVQDQRDVPEGVFAGYLDIGLDSTLVSRNGTIVFGENYPNGHTFDVTDPDLINEIGAFAGFTPLGGGESLLVTIPMHADAAGTAVFDADFADEVPNESLLYGDDVGIPVEQIVMVDAALQIVAGSGELPDANL
jgi:hypothetical protein